MQSCKFRTLAYLQSWNIQDPGIFKVRPIFKTLSKIEDAAKIVKSYNYFFKALYCRSLTGLWICPSLNRYSSTCRVTLCYVLYETFRTLRIIINSDILRHIYILFRHIQPYCDIFRMLCNSSTLVYSELCQEIFWHIQNAVKCCVNAERCLTLAY